MMVCLTVQAQTKPKLKVVNPVAQQISKPLAKTQMSILKNLEDSFSYALGLNIANNLIQQGIDKISNAAMQRAMDDVFNKKPYLLNEQQSNTCIKKKFRVVWLKK